MTLRFSEPMDEIDLWQAIIECGRICQERRLLMSNGGNLSVRMDAGRVLITPSGMQMVIVRATAVTDELIDAITRLMPQLKLKYVFPSRTEIEAMLASNATALLIVRHPNETSSIVGMLTLIIYQVPSGMRAHLEDIVIDEKVRGQGIGEALVRYALDIAREAGANGVALTSNSHREAANRLYQRIGFKRWETNIYFYEF